MVCAFGELRFERHHALDHAAAVGAAVDIVAEMDDAGGLLLERDAVEDGVVQGAWSFPASPCTSPMAK